MNSGKIILLNGVTCIEKTNICTALQAVLDEPALYLGLEQLIDLLPNYKQVLPVGADRLASTPRSNAMENNALYACDSCGQQVISGMHRMIAALASAGNYVIADHFLFDLRWLRECALLFCDLPVLLVSVRCPQEMSETYPQVTTLDTPGVYDLEVDPSLFSAHQCALQIKERMLAGVPPMAWHWLKVWSDPAKHRGWIRGCPDQAELRPQLGAAHLTAVHEKRMKKL
ncbi:MAG: hypothetical protein R3C14_13770 [Caldilineaceae bacterium]